MFSHTYQYVSFDIFSRFNKCSNRRFIIHTRLNEYMATNIVLKSNSFMDDLSVFTYLYIICNQRFALAVSRNLLYKYM